MLAARIEKEKKLHKHVHQRLVLYGLDVLSG